MILCLCRGVSDRTVRLTVLQGAQTLDDVGEACGAGTCCGTCREDIERVIHAESAARRCADCLGDALTLPSDTASAVAGSR
jgi:bacterioferritin-associated ferredoxin